MTTASLSRQRPFVHPEPGDTIESLAARVLPGETTTTAVEKLKSWNLHIFLRRPPGLLLGSDIVFVEGP
jgi:hypothetical protein